MDKLDTVRKLLAMADDLSLTEEARQSYREKATELMIKYGIEDAELAAQNATPDAKIVYVQHAPLGPKTYATEFVYLGIRVAKALGGKALYYGKDKLGLVCWDTDVDRILLMWRSLETQASHELAAAIKKEHSWSYMSGMEKYKFRRAFIIGFAEEINRRMTIVYKKVVEETTGTSTALVIYDRAEALKNFMDSLGLGKKRTRSYSLDGVMAGQRAGVRADIGQSGFGKSSQKSIGGM